MSFKEFLKDEPIMIVEDNLSELETMKDLLSEFEVPILTFSNPFDALRVLKSLTPVMIISDMNMEGMNGLDLAREVKTL